MPAYGDFTFDVSEGETGLRLDAFLADHLQECSRSHAAELVRQGLVRVDGIERKAGYKVKACQEVSGRRPPPQSIDVDPEPMALDILYEDSSLIVVDKPAGLVVHPSAGHASGTLVNGLLYHCPDLEGIGGERRPGIVHRLDKDTSGVLVVAKNDHAHHSLSAQFKARLIQKVYLSLVHGVPAVGRGQIDLPVGRHPKERKKMSATAGSGRQALTQWRVRRRFRDAALLALDLKTGRTHQIRVHCQAIGHPVVGDPLYGPKRLRKQLTRENPVLWDVFRQAKRQMLHARRITFTHPDNHRLMTFAAPLPGDMAGLIDKLAELMAS